MKAKDSTQKNLNLLLAGKHRLAKKYAGKHVMVLENEIIPLKENKETLKDMEKLEKKYGRTPTLVFVPRPDISYILVLCR